MAQLRRQLQGDFQTILAELEDKILGGSASATSSDFNTAHCRCAVRVYERYSLIGSNRLSLSITLLQDGDEIFISAIAAGGSNAVLFKINTVGEDAFLAQIEQIVDRYSI